jgi:seryl-tRNA synthetase
MLELRFIRDHVEEVRAGAEAKGMTVDLKKIIEFDDRRRR